MGERGRSERGRGGGVPMIWVCERNRGKDGTAFTLWRETVGVDRSGSFEALVKHLCMR